MTSEMYDVIELLGGQPPRSRQTRPAFLIEQTTEVAAYHRLRRAAFVDELGLFDRDDRDVRDDHPQTVVLVAKDAVGDVVGGVRLHPVTDDPLLGWWQGGRLVVRPGAPYGVGGALVRAACATAEAFGALRFDAQVLDSNAGFFHRLGWVTVGHQILHGAPHTLMEWPIQRISALVGATKRALGPLLEGLRPGGEGFVGDDCAPVPGSDVLTSVDAILPAMVERDPEWAGWCGVLVGANDLGAMGAAPLGALDALGASDAAHAARVLTGLRMASAAYGLPLLGGHTQLGVPASLAVTVLGQTRHPVPSGGGRPGHQVRLTADVGGSWRPGYSGRQWDSTSTRRGEDLRAMTGSVAVARPHAAKDVSMAGIVGTLGMLAEASGCGAELDVAAVQRPAGVSAGDWFTCFPGFAMLTCADNDDAPPPAGPATTAAVGQLTAGAGIHLRWPDGRVTTVLDGPVTGLGTA